MKLNYKNTITFVFTIFMGMWCTHITAADIADKAWMSPDPIIGGELFVCQQETVIYCKRGSFLKHPSVRCLERILFEQNTIPPFLKRILSKINFHFLQRILSKTTNDPLSSEDPLQKEKISLHLQRGSSQTSKFMFLTEDPL